MRISMRECFYSSKGICDLIRQMLMTEKIAINESKDFFISLI